MPGVKQLGKSSGLIFLRRSFKDDPVYKASLRHYIATLIDKGEHLTWNIEGYTLEQEKLCTQNGDIEIYLRRRAESSRD